MSHSESTSVCMCTHTGTPSIGSVSLGNHDTDVKWLRAGEMIEFSRNIWDGKVSAQCLCSC
jgi:hypothetical protein